MRQQILQTWMEADVYAQLIILNTGIQGSKLNIEKHMEKPNWKLFLLSRNM